MLFPSSFLTRSFFSSFLIPLSFLSLDGADTNVLIRRRTLIPRVDYEDEAELADDDDELENEVEISSASDSEASTGHMDKHPTLAAQLPTVGMTIGASPTTTSLALDHQPRPRTLGSKRVSNSSAPTASKIVKRTPIANPDERAQLFHAGLHDAIKALTKDFELLKSAKATHSSEVKNLKAEMAKLNANLAGERENSNKLAEELKSAQEDALEEFKESEAFHEEVMAHADMHAQTVVDKWLVGPVDLGEADYGLGYQDAQKEIFDQLKARYATFSPTSWGLRDQGADDAIKDASADITGDEIPMDNAYLNSLVNLNFVVGMDRNPIPTLAKDDLGDTVATEE
nr:tubby-related protein 1-like isoform X1 [Ipomoea batatas]